MQMIILGSGSPLPDPERAGPSTLVRTGAGDLLFDCGRGVLMRAAAAGSAAGALRGLFLTHLHSDHTTDLNDIVTSRWITSFQPQPAPRLRPRRHGVARAGDRGHAGARHRLPPGPSRRSAVAADGATSSNASAARCWRTEDVRVSAAPTDHAPVRPTVGFRVDEGGRSVVIAGDTVPCPGLDELCAGADMLVHTVVRPDLIEPIGLPRLTRRPRLPLLGRGRGADRGAQRRRHPVLTHLVPAPAAGHRARVAGTGRRALRRHRDPGPGPVVARGGPDRLSACRSEDRFSAADCTGQQTRPQKTMAPAWARGSLAGTISFPSGAMATAASLKFPRPSGMPMMVRQSTTPRSRWEMRHPQSRQDEPQDIGQGRRRPGLRLAHHSPSERPQHEGRQAEAGQAEGDGDDQEAQQEAGQRVADRQPEAREHQPDQIEQCPHRRPPSTRGCAGAGAASRRTLSSRSSRNASASSSSRGAERDVVSAHESSRSASAGLRASTGPCRYVPTMRPWTAPSLPSPTPLPTPATTCPSAAVPSPRDVRPRGSRTRSAWAAARARRDPPRPAPRPPLVARSASPCRRRGARPPRAPRRRRRERSARRSGNRRRPPARPRPRPRAGPACRRR